MPRRELLTPTERVQLFAFPEDESELIRLATLARSDLTYIRQHRGDHNRLGLAVQRTNDPLRSYTDPDPDYRSEKLRYLNHNERTHQLQRQIRKAGSGSTRGRRDEELSAQSHCLALCTNLVMAYNTSCLQRTLDAWRKTSARQIDTGILRFISPMGFEHINFNGVIVFPFQHYADQLLTPRRGGRTRSAGI